jgi:hypothetical protein
MVFFSVAKGGFERSWVKSFDLQEFDYFVRFSFEHGNHREPDCLLF